MFYKSSWYWQGDNIASLNDHCDKFTSWLDDQLNSNRVIDWKIQKDMVKGSDNFKYHVWVLTMQCAEDDDDE